MDRRAWCATAAVTFTATGNASCPNPTLTCTLVRVANTTNAMKHSELTLLKTAIASVLTGDIAVPLRVKLLKLRQEITKAQEPFMQALNSNLAAQDAELAEIAAAAAVKVQNVLAEEETAKAAAREKVAAWRSTAEQEDVSIPPTDLMLADFNDLPAIVMKHAEPLLLLIPSTPAA